MSTDDIRPRHARHGKFTNAWRGTKRAVRSESSFFVHLFAAAAVLAAGLVLRVTWVEWALLVLAISGVLTAEMLNTALEHLVRGITHEYHPQFGHALDIASAGVLVASAGSVIVGLVVFGRHLLGLGGWLF